MLRDNTIGVAVPAFQVGEHLDDVIAAVPEFVDRIVIVNDASTDRTAEIAEALTKQDRVHVIHHEHNRGVGAAVVSGFQELAAAGCGVLVKLDGDGQMDPSLIGRLVDPLADGWADYAKGNRLSSRSDYRTMPITRLAGSVALTMFTKLASGYWQTMDPQNGFVAIRRETFERLDLRRIDSRYFFENSMLIALNQISARCMDVQMAATYGNETSHLSIWRVMIAFPPKLVAGFCRRIVRRYLLLDFSPVLPLFVLGVFLLVCGSLWGAYHWWLSAATGRIATTGTVMLAVLPIFSGLQLVLQALVLDIENGRALTVQESVYHRDRRNAVEI